MAVLYGLEFQHQSSSASKPHILSYLTSRSVADDSMFEVWNGATDSDRVFKMTWEGQLQVEDGTAAKPSYGFKSDKDSGRYMSGAGTFLDVIAGTAVGTWTAGKLTLVQLQVDNLNINGNTLSSTAGTDLLITPLSGQQIVLDSTIVIDAGVVTGATSITSDAFVGPITGTASVATLANTVVVVDGTDTSSSIAMFDSATGSLAIKTDAGLTYNAGTGMLTATGLTGPLTGLAATATALETARTIGGTSFDGTANIAVALATLATTVTITDNESTDESNALIFTAGGDVDGGNLGLESDGTLTYNPSTGKVTATGFIGTLAGAVTGDVTGNVSGTALTVTQAAQTAITSVGTLTALQVDNLNLNGNTISSTAGTDLLITPLSGQQIVLDGAIVIDAGVVTGATSITTTAVDTQTLVVDTTSTLTGAVTASSTVGVTGKLTQGSGSHTVSADADDLVVNVATGNGGITIATADAGIGNIYFANASDSIAARLVYNGPSGSGVFSVGSANAGDVLILQAGNQTTFLTGSGANATFAGALAVTGGLTQGSGSHTVSADADDLVVNVASGNGGITIATADAGIGSIYFANASDSIAARLVYNGSSGSGVFSVGSANAGDVLLLQAGNQTTFLTGSGANATFAGTLAVTGTIRGQDGSAGAPAYSFTADTNTGMYRVASDQLGFAVAGAEVFRAYPGAIRNSDGVVATPAYSFTGDTDTGMYRSAANTVAFAAGGTHCLSLTASAATFSAAMAVTGATTLTGNVALGGNLTGAADSGAYTIFGGGNGDGGYVQLYGSGHASGPLLILHGGGGVVNVASAATMASTLTVAGVAKGLRFNATTVADTTNETNPGLMIGGTTTHDQVLYAGINKAGTYSYIGAVRWGIAYNELKIQPNGGIINLAQTTYINDTTNSFATLGLTVNQGAADNEILALKSSDVGHNMTNKAEADTYGTFSKYQADAGGLAVKGLKDADGTAGLALVLQGFLGEPADDAKTASAIGIVQVETAVTAGDGNVAAAAGDANLFVVADNGNARFIFDKEGTAHADDVWTDSVY